jgi:SAM-dependent methyltransferase
MIPCRTPENSVEYVSCDLCGADQPHVLFWGRDRLHNMPGRFRLVQCSVCGLIYLNPRPAMQQMGQYYPADYRPYIAAVQSARNRVSRLDASYGLYKRLRAVEILQPPGRLLDIGCGSGDFLAFARRHGWEAQGVEVEARAASFCRDELGLPVVTGDFVRSNLPAGHFDVITMWNVFEHLHEPTAALREVGRVLRPGGLFVSASPDVGSLDARIFGPAWIGYDMPRHLYTFSEATLSRMLAQAGFHVVRRRCLESSHFVFFFSLDFWLQDRLYLKRARPWVSELANSRLVRLLMAPYFRVVDALVKGPVVTTFARQDDRA